MCCSIIQSPEHWNQIPEDIKEKNCEGTVKLFYKLSPSSYHKNFATSTTINKIEPGIFIGIVDLGQLSEEDRVHYQLGEGGIPKAPKYSQTNDKIHLTLNEFETLKTTAPYILASAKYFISHPPTNGEDCFKLSKIVF